MNEDSQNQQQAQPTKVTKTWFIEKENGEIFAINEKGAWDLQYNQNRNNLYSRKYKIVGVSDGRTYVDIIKNSQNEKAELERLLSTESDELSRYVNTLDRFKFNELLEDEDPKVLRAKELIKKKEENIADINNKLVNIHKIIIEKAFKAELEKARGNIEKPANNDIFTPSSSREVRNKIINSLGIR